MSFFTLVTFSNEITFGVAPSISIPLLGGLGDESFPEGRTANYNQGGHSLLGLGAHGRFGYMVNETLEANLYFGFDYFLPRGIDNDDASYSVTNIPIYVSGRLYSGKSKIDYFELGLGMGLATISFEDATNSINTVDNNLSSFGFMLAYGMKLDLGVGQDVDTKIYYRYQMTKEAEVKVSQVDTKLGYNIAHLGVMFSLDWVLAK
jgi:hypothetical protein